MWDFGPDFFEWWAGLTPMVRYGVAIVLLGIGAALCYFTKGGYFAWGSLVVCGAVLLVFAGRTKDE